MESLGGIESEAMDVRPDSMIAQEMIVQDGLTDCGKLLIHRACGPLRKLGSITD